MTFGGQRYCDILTRVKKYFCVKMNQSTTTKLSADIQEQVKKGIAVLRQGGIIAYPTDTVYGLGASAFLPTAVERIFRVKERPLNMPLPLLLAGVNQLSAVTGPANPEARSLIKAFLPGALTLVLPAAGSVPDIITAGSKTVAVRIPAHPVPLALIKGLGDPIVGTSANPSGLPSPLTADEVRSQLGDKIDFIIDAGKCPGGKESTIVDVTGEKPVVLREGAIPLEELRKICPDITLKEEN